MPILRLHRLELPIHLGWSDEERRASQIVEIDLDIAFPDLPRSCITDDLADGIDYAQLVSLLRDLAARRPYALLEHFTHEAMSALRKAVPPSVSLTLRVTKFPALEGLRGGASFTLADRPS